MIENKWRPLAQTRFIDPFIKKTGLLHFHPNVLSIAACLFGLLTLPLLCLHCRFLSLSALFLSGFLDILDGSVARLKDLSSEKGAALDIICDRVVESAIIIGLFLYVPAYPFLSLLMLSSVLICVTSFLVVGIFTPKAVSPSVKAFYYSPGLIERCEAFFFFAAMILFPSFFALLSTLFSLLVLYTAFLRTFQFIIKP